MIFWVSEIKIKNITFIISRRTFPVVSLLRLERRVYDGMVNFLSISSCYNSNICSYLRKNRAKIGVISPCMVGYFHNIVRFEAQLFITRINRHVSACRPFFFWYMTATCIFPLFRENFFFPGKFVWRKKISNYPLWQGEKTERQFRREKFWTLK